MDYETRLSAVLGEPVGDFNLKFYIEFNMDYNIGFRDIAVLKKRHCRRSLSLALFFFGMGVGCWSDLEIRRITSTG